MYFEEDPLDRVCRQIVMVLWCMEQLIEITLLHIVRQVWYRLQKLKLLAVKHSRKVWRRLRLLFTTLYVRQIRGWLVRAGLKPRLTWADVEALRLRLIARSGIDLPRPPELERGLQREQAHEAS